MIDHSLIRVDSRFRIFIPEAGPSLLAFKAEENCLFLYPLDLWEKRQFPAGNLREPVEITRDGGWFALPLEHAAEAQLAPGQAAVIVPRGNGYVLAHWSRWEEYENDCRENGLMHDADRKALDWRATLGMGFGHLVR